MRTVRYFDGRTYEWVGISRQPNIIGKVCSRCYSHHKYIRTSFSSDNYLFVLLSYILCGVSIILKQKKPFPIVFSLDSESGGILSEDKMILW